MMPRKASIVSFLLALAALGGCAERDPYLRTDVWRPSGANMGNLAAQLADPHDLIRGRSSPPGPSGAATIAISRVNNDQPRPLASGAASSSSSGSSGAGVGGGGGSSGGAPASPGL